MFECFLKSNSGFSKLLNWAALMNEHFFVIQKIDLKLALGSDNNTILLFWGFWEGRRGPSWGAHWVARWWARWWAWQPAVQVSSPRTLRHMEWCLSICCRWPFPCFSSMPTFAGWSGPPEPCSWPFWSDRVKLSIGYYAWIVANTSVYLVFCFCF